MKNMIILFSFAFFLGKPVFSDNTIPAYCSPDTFLSYEQNLGQNPLVRLRIFKIGNIHLAGFGVGNSLTADSQKLATMFAKKLSPLDGYCTWYFGSGNASAEKTFNFRPLPPIFGHDVERSSSAFYEILQDEFSVAVPHYLACMVENGYLAMGCEEMKHRGPSAFGMLLAYSGCDPKSAYETVNKIWGLNGIDPNVRLAIIQKGFQLGNEQPDGRLKMRMAFEGKALRR